MQALDVPTNDSRASTTEVSQIAPWAYVSKCFTRVEACAGRAIPSRMSMPVRAVIECWGKCGMFALMVAACVPPAAASAQTVGTTAGAINGVVTDASKAVVPGVTVTLSGPAVMGSPTTVSDASGQYRFAAVPPGEYRLQFELAGFGGVVRDGIRVGIGFTATVDVEVNPAALNESVTVTGAAPVVDLRATDVTTHFETDRLANLPGAHDFHSSILAQVPAVTMNRVDVGGNNAIHGLRYDGAGPRLHRRHGRDLREQQRDGHVPRLRLDRRHRRHAPRVVTAPSSREQM